MWHGRHTIIRFLQFNFIIVVLALSSIMLTGARVGGRTPWIVILSIFTALFSLLTWIWVYTYFLSTWPVRPDWAAAVVSAWTDVFNILLWIVGAIVMTAVFRRHRGNSDIDASGMSVQPWYPSQGQVLATFLWLGMS